MRVSTGSKPKSQTQPVALKVFRGADKTRFSQGQAKILDFWRVSGDNSFYTSVKDGQFSEEISSAFILGAQDPQKGPAQQRGGDGLPARVGVRWAKRPASRGSAPAPAENPGRKKGL